MECLSKRRSFYLQRLHSDSSASNFWAQKPCFSVLRASLQHLSSNGRLFPLLCNNACGYDIRRHPSHLSFQMFPIWANSWVYFLTHSVSTPLCLPVWATQFTHIQLYRLILYQYFSSSESTSQNQDLSLRGRPFASSFTPSKTQSTLNSKNPLRNVLYMSERIYRRTCSGGASLWDSSPFPSGVHLRVAQGKQTLSSV